MRIALVGTRGVPAAYGGFETAVEEVGRRLADSGHDVVVYCRTTPGSTAEQPATHLGMRLVHLPAARKRALETLSHTALSVGHLVTHRTDAAFVFNAANAPLLPVIRAARIPVATHVDGLEWKRTKWSGTGQKYYRMAESLAVRWSDALIADAQGIADYYTEEFGAPTDLITYGAPVIDPPADRLAELGLTARGYHLVVARFEPENHVAEIVEGYTASGATQPLVVVGSAPYSDEYTARVHGLADDRVRFLGGVWDQDLLDVLYAHATTYLHGHSVGAPTPRCCAPSAPARPCWPTTSPSTARSSASPAGSSPPRPTSRRCWPAPRTTRPTPASAARRPASAPAPTTGTTSPPATPTSPAASPPASSRAAVRRPSVDPGQRAAGGARAAGRRPGRPAVGRVTAVLTPARRPEPGETVGDTVRRLAGAQKGAKGAPAYSRFVNRPIGRVLAALAFHRGLTPDAVTGLSAVCTFTGLAVVALAPHTWPTGVLVAALLVLGYALDSADGQLARLRGGGSPAGEWLDHAVDSVKVVAVHLCVLVGLFRTGELATGWLLVPLGFAVVAVTHFSLTLLNDALRAQHGARTRAARAVPGSGPACCAPCSSRRPTTACCAWCSCCSARRRCSSPPTASSPSAPPDTSCWRCRAGGPRWRPSVVRTGPRHELAHHHAAPLPPAAGPGRGGGGRRPGGPGPVPHHPGRRVRRRRRHPDHRAR